MKYTKEQLKNKSKAELIEIILKTQKKSEQTFGCSCPSITIADGTQGMQRGI